MDIFSINYGDSTPLSINPFEIKKDQMGQYITTDQNLIPLSTFLCYSWNRDLPDKPAPSQGQLLTVIDLLRSYFAHINTSKMSPSWQDFNSYHDVESQFPVGGF